MPTAFDFSGQAVVVTGVGRVGQIGNAVADGFAKAGARLVISDVNAVGVAQRAKEFIARGFEVKAAAGDLSQPDVARWVIEQAQQSYGRVDVLVNVAGGLTGIAPASEAAADVLDREMAINAKTMFQVSRVAAKAMAEQRRGAIVSFSSLAGLHGRASMAAYSAAKAAVAALTRALALELRDVGVRVNAVAPGTVRTSDNRSSMGDMAGQATWWVEIADIVNAVMFLASDAAAGITGHVLPVSRGEL